MRLLTYAHCECGQLVRCGRHAPNTDAGIALHNVGATGYAGECPGCKAVVQITVTKTEVIIKPAVHLVQP